MSDLPVVLHNMSCRPTTRVTWDVERVGRTLVGFRIDEAARSVSPLDAEDAWRGFGLTGAILLYHVPDNVAADAPQVPDAWITDPAIVLNVLGRTRGPLLLPHVPIDRDPVRLARVLSTDDPRLVALAARPAPAGDIHDDIDG